MNDDTRQNGASELPHALEDPSLSALWRAVGAAQLRRGRHSDGMLALRGLDASGRRALSVLLERQVREPVKVNEADLDRSVQGKWSVDLAGALASVGVSGAPAAGSLFTRRPANDDPSVVPVGTGAVGAVEPERPSLAAAFRRPTRVEDVPRTGRGDELAPPVAGPSPVDVEGPASAPDVSPIGEDAPASEADVAEPAKSAARIEPEPVADPDEAVEPSASGEPGPGRGPEGSDALVEAGPQSAPESSVDLVAAREALLDQAEESRPRITPGAFRRRPLATDEEPGAAAAARFAAGFRLEPPKQVPPREFLPDDVLHEEDLTAPEQPDAFGPGRETSFANLVAPGSDPNSPPPETPFSALLTGGPERDKGRRFGRGPSSSDEVASAPVEPVRPAGAVEPARSDEAVAGPSAAPVDPLAEPAPSGPAFRFPSESSEIESSEIESSEAESSEIGSSVPGTARPGEPESPDLLPPESILSRPDATDDDTLIGLPPVPAADPGPNPYGDFVPWVSDRRPVAAESPVVESPVGVSPAAEAISFDTRGPGASAGEPTALEAGGLPQRTRGSRAAAPLPAELTGVGDSTDAGVTASSEAAAPEETGPESSPRPRGGISLGRALGRSRSRTEPAAESPAGIADPVEPEARPAGTEWVGAAAVLDPEDGSPAEPVIDLRQEPSEGTSSAGAPETVGMGAPLDETPRAQPPSSQAIQDMKDALARVRRSSPHVPAFVDVSDSIAEPATPEPLTPEPVTPEPLTAENVAPGSVTTRSESPDPEPSDDSDDSDDAAAPAAGFAGLVSRRSTRPRPAAPDAPAAPEPAVDPTFADAGVPDPVDHAAPLPPAPTEPDPLAAAAAAVPDSAADPLPPLAAASPAGVARVEPPQVVVEAVEEWLATHPGTRLGPWVPDWLSAVHADTVLSDHLLPEDLDRALAILADLSAEHPAPRSRHQLALDLTGDKGSLDDDRLVGRLVLHGLAARAGIPMPPTSRARRELWIGADVLPDLVSATALVVGIAPLADAENGRGRWWAAAGEGAPVHVSGWDLRSRAGGPWRGWDAERPVIVCSSPRVLEGIAQRFGGALPVVCTNGRPGLVVGELLRRLKAGGADLHFLVDLDWAGIAVGNHLMAEYDAVPLGLSAQDYKSHLREGLPALTGAPVDALWDPDLRAVLLENDATVPEDLLLPALLTDLAEPPA